MTMPRATTGSPVGLLGRIGTLLMLVLGALLLPAGARADCTYISGTGPTNVTFNVPSPLTIPITAPVGTVLYTTPLVSPAAPPTMACSGTTYYGVVDALGATPATGVNVYPTNIPGIGYKLTHGNLTTFMYPYPCCTLAPGNYSFSIGTSLQLVKTGPIASGQSLPSGPLGYWQYDSNQRPEAFTLASPVTIIEACSVNTTPLNVTLPSISTSALPAIGSTAGTTGFAISLTCSSGAILSIQFDYAGTSSGITGVLTKTAGTSSGVGVRMLDTNSNPVTFGTPATVGSTVNGQMNLPYYAQYYRTGAVTAGTLTASATFTLSYQ